MKTGRNDPCPCGSGKKFKKCCLVRSAAGCPPGATPAELVRARAQAFAEGDFALIYDSYHSQSNFRLQFPDRASYIRHGRSTLGREFAILQCRVLKERIGSDEAGVIFYIETDHAGNRTESLDLAVFHLEAGEWRFFSSQKMALEEFEGEIEQIDWEDFELNKDKIFF